MGSTTPVARQKCLCRFVMCTSQGLVFNPYASLPRHTIGSMVRQLGARVGVFVAPRPLRCSFVTNMLTEDSLAGGSSDMTYINVTGGWALGSAVPMNSYASAQAMAARFAHTV